MNNVVFVNPPNHKNDRFDLAPPLGLLVLSRVARSLGWDPHLVDLALSPDDADDAHEFFTYALAAILNHDPRVVCFTSMGVNTHVSLELAERIKEADSSVIICAGGVHFSSLATGFGSAFPAIDTFVVGEGEEGLRSVLASLDDRIHEELPRIVTAPSLGGIPEHPHSSYELISIDEYFSLNQRRVANYEGGRGCVFKCSFCYSPNYYQSVREVPPERIVEDWSRLASLGFGHVFMVQDNFTNSPTHAIAVCEALAAADLPITWNAYATLPQLTVRLAEALGSAKCKQIYLGVDAVTDAQSATFNKRFYRSSEHLLSSLQALRNAGVEPTCAFMLNLFDFDESEAEQTLGVAAECAAAGVSIRLNTFTRYLGSGLADSGNGRSRYSEAKVRIALDCPQVVRENKFARQIPEAFPFHATEEPDEAVWVERLRTVWLAQRLIQAYPDDFAAFASRADNPTIFGLNHLAKSADVEGILKATGNPYMYNSGAELY